MEICCECVYSLMVPIVSLVRIELGLSPSWGPFLYGPYPVRNAWKGFESPCPRFAGNVVFNLPWRVYNELWRMPECNKEFSLCSSQNAACLPWQVSRSCPELLNLESQSTWRCQWSSLNVQWLCMIIWTWVLSSWRCFFFFSFRPLMRIEPVTVLQKRNVWIIVGRSVPRAYLSYFFLASIMIYLIPLVRARVLNHNPRVQSLQFKNRSGKIQWLPNCQGCPRESLEGVVPLVLMRLSIWASV